MLLVLGIQHQNKSVSFSGSARYRGHQLTLVAMSSSHDALFITTKHGSSHHIKRIFSTCIFATNACITWYKGGRAPPKKSQLPFSSFTKCYTFCESLIILFLHVYKLRPTFLF